MSRRKVSYSKTGISKLPNNKPVIYKIQTTGGKTNYAGIAGRGNVRDRIADHLGDIPGASVTVSQFKSIAEARSTESRVIKRSKPKYNKQGK